jgi:hypothetical protein
VPEHAPDQPVNVDPGDGAAVSVTGVPWRKLCVQVEPQLIPSGLDVTTPAPVPAVASASALSLSKVAVTARSAFTVTVQVAVPEQAPDQPVNDEPAAGVAVSVTGTEANGAEQVAPQAIPFGLEVTVPDPLPAVETVTELPL